jgi:hypothetical protein
MNLKAKKRSPRNRTVDLTKREIAEYSKKLISIKRPAEVEQILNKTINQIFLMSWIYCPIILLIY